MLEWMWFGILAVGSTAMAVRVTYRIGQAELKDGDIALYLGLSCSAVMLLVDLVGMSVFRDISALLPEEGTTANLVTTLVFGISCIAGVPFIQLIALPHLLKLDECATSHAA